MKGLLIEEAKKYIKKFPSAGNSELGRMLYKDQPELFDSSESGRYAIRRARGSAGKKMRKYVDKKEVKYMPNGYHSRWHLPHEDHNDVKPLVLSGEMKVGVLSDIHIPYQANEPINAFLDYFYKEKVDTIVLNGDILDCYQLSNFVKDPRKRNFFEELGMARDFMERIRDIFPKKTRIIFKEGNHEERYERFLMMKARELLGIDEYELKNILHLNELNIEYVGNKKRIRLNRLWVLHGHEFGRSVFSPVNPARGYFMRAKDNVLAGHNHQTSKHREPSLSFKPFGAWSTGCLSDLHPEYMPINKWNWGAAMVALDKDGEHFNVHNMEYMDGRITK